jgi:hypothetical protein
VGVLGLTVFLDPYAKGGFFLRAVAVFLVEAACGEAAVDLGVEPARIVAADVSLCSSEFDEDSVGGVRGDLVAR